MIKLVKEEEQKVKVEPIPVDQPKELEVADKTAAIACEEAVSSLMQYAWDFISNVNSVIATLDVNYKEAVKDDVIELLNAIIDDSTINIGMLQKITNMMNIKKVDLLDAGEVKAEEILTQADDSK